MLTHEKVHQCVTCGKIFLLKCDLQKHLQCHAVEKKPYACTIRTKTFSQSGDLKEDILAHEKVYNCSICCLTFKEQTHLYDHMDYHTKSKPFLCYFCNTGFQFDHSISCSCQKSFTSYTRQTF